MNQIHLFRILVVFSWTLQLFIYVLPITSWYSDPAIKKLMAIDGYGAIFLPESQFLYQAPLWGFLIASLGMLSFKSWARYLFLALWLHSVIATLFYGFRVSEPVQIFIGLLISTADGMIIYLAFLSALRIEFTNAKLP
jgi:hypothetical protein